MGKRFYFLSNHKPLREQVIAAKSLGCDEIICLNPVKPEDRVDGVQYVGSQELLIVPDDPALGRGWFVSRAATIVASLGEISEGDIVTIGGQSNLVNAVQAILRMAGCVHVESVSARVSQDETLPDGSVRKTSVFQFAGFRPAYDSYF